jgi:hypothetical protein
MRTTLDGFGKISYFRNMTNKLTQEMLERGELLAWADSEATRLSKLSTFQPKGWTAVGHSRAWNGMKRQLRAAGYPMNAANMLMQDICDMARLKAVAR